MPKKVMESCTAAVKIVLQIRDVPSRFERRIPTSLKLVTQGSLIIQH